MFFTAFTGVQHLSSLGDSQPMLETGSLVGNHIYTKSCSDDLVTHNSSHADHQTRISDEKVPCYLVQSLESLPSTTICNVNVHILDSECKGSLVGVGTLLEQQSKHSFLWEKTKKTGSLHGVITGANIT